MGKGDKPKGRVSFTSPSDAQSSIAQQAAGAAASRFADANTGGSSSNGGCGFFNKNSYCAAEYSGSSFSPTHKRRMELERLLGSRGALVGIKNIGATCYAASLLQTIFMTPEMREHVIRFPFEERQRHKNNIAYQLQLMFAQMQSPRKPYVDPTNLLLSFNMGPGAHTQQHDVQELNRQLVDVIQGFIDRTPGVHQVINELYRGTMADVKKCRGCGLERGQGGNVFLDLQVPFAGIAHNLDEALAAQTKPDEIEGYKCEGCFNEKGPQTLEMGRAFECFPRVLSLHLMRFDFNYETMRREKKLDDLALPVELAVAKFLAKPQQQAQATNDDDASQQQQQQKNEVEPDKFDLSAMICHRGTPFSGHYYVFIRVADTDEELEKLCPPKKDSSSSNSSKKPNEVVEMEAEAKRIIGGNWIKFDDQTVTLADPDEVLQYMDPALWKARKEAARAKKQAECDAKREREKKETEVAAAAASSSPTSEDGAVKEQSTSAAATAATDASTTTSGEATGAAGGDGYVTHHPLMAFPTVDPQTSSTPTTTMKNDGSAVRGLTDKDEADIANIFSAFNGMTGASGGGSDSTMLGPAVDYSAKISGHSYYVLYRRRDMPAVRASDVVAHPPSAAVPEYVKSQTAAAEKELADADAELQQLLPVVSVAVHLNNDGRNKRWIDVREETSVDTLTELAYNALVVEPNNRSLILIPEDNKAAAAASASATAAAANTHNNNNNQSQTQPVVALPAGVDNKLLAEAALAQSPMMDNRADSNHIAEQEAQQKAAAAASAAAARPPPDFSPAIARLRKFSTQHSVGGASFKGSETMLSLGSKASSGTAGTVFVLETRTAEEAAAMNGAWPEATELDFAFRVARLTAQTPLNQPITEFERVVVPARAKLSALYAACAAKFKVEGGAANTQLTLRKDGEAVPLAIWEPRTFGGAASSSSATTGGGAICCSPSAGAAVTSSSQPHQDATAEGGMGKAASSDVMMTSIFDEGVEMTELSYKKKSETSPTSADAAATSKNSSEQQQQQPVRPKQEDEKEDDKPYYRNLDLVSIDLAGLRQDDAIYVEAFDRSRLPPAAEDFKQNLIAVQFVDYQYLVRIFWSVSTGIEIPEHLAKVANEPIYIDKRKTLAQLKQRLCEMLGSVSLDDCQLLLDGAVRETKNLNQTIRSATYGLSSLNAEIRKGRPLQDTESYVTVYRAMDYFLDPVEQIKRLLIKSDTSIAALAAAALDPAVKNESAVPDCYEEEKVGNGGSTETTTTTATTHEDAAASSSSSGGATTTATAGTTVEGGVSVVAGERSQAAAGGGATRVTSVCVNGQHYRPRLMPPGSNVRAWGVPMYKREVKNNLTNQHVSEVSEVRVVLQPIPHEEALTKSSLLLRLHRWSSAKATVVEALGPAQHVVLQKDGPLEMILDVIAALDDQIHPDNIEYARCRPYQLRGQDSIVNDLMWLSKSILDMESGKRRTLSGHPMKFESDDVVLFRDSDEPWPAGTEAHFGFDTIQSNADAKKQNKKLLQGGGGGNDADIDEDDALGKDGKKKPGSKAKKSSGPAERGISLRVVWDDAEVESSAPTAESLDAAAASSATQDGVDSKAALSKNNGSGGGKKNKSNSSNNKNPNKSAEDIDEDDDTSSTGGNDGDDADAKMAQALQLAEDSSGTRSTASRGNVAALYGCKPEELINFVSCESYNQLHAGSLPVQCCVCFCEFETGEDVVVTRCRPTAHIVHKDCLAPWLPTSFTCPSCKTSLDM